MRTLLLCLAFVTACGSDQGSIQADASRDGGRPPAPPVDLPIDEGDGGAMSSEDDASAPGAFTLLQANVGNLDFGCKGYIYKLCAFATEDTLRTSIAALAPDVVALQEVTSRAQCAAMNETDVSKVCHPSHSGEPEQSRRLVGAGYTIACASRNGYECVAVKTTFASIEGCVDGAFCGAAELVAAPTNGCDQGFTVGSVVIRPRSGAAFTLVNAHPPSGPTGSSIACREDQVRRIFEDVPPDTALVAKARSLVTGDFNLDPYNDDEASVTTFKRHVDATGSDGRLHFHSGIAEHSPPYPTGFTLVSERVLDHVASDFAKGTCTTLGQAPGTKRIDGGSGTDHRALSCILSL